MGIEVDLTGFYSKMDEIRRRVGESLPAFLASVGDAFVERAIATKTYQDRTGRLTASIGYGLVQGGAVVSVGGFGGGDGEADGMDALHRAAAEVQGDDIALVVVAGADYALYVERKGFSVLDGATLDIDDIVAGLNKELTL